MSMSGGRVIESLTIEDPRIEFGRGAWNCSDLSGKTFADQVEPWFVKPPPNLRSGDF
jgi:hypothetical protein